VDTESANEKEIIEAVKLQKVGSVFRYLA